MTAHHGYHKEKNIGTWEQKWKTIDAIRHKSYIRNSRFPPPKINMPHMSSIYASAHSAHNLIYALHNPAPEISLYKLEN